MLRALVLAQCLALSAALMAPMASPSLSHNKLAMSKVAMNGGKGFGGGEATRDPPPTVYNPNDPKGKQQAIHKAESFAEYLAKRQSSGVGVSVPVASITSTQPPAAARAWNGQNQNVDFDAVPVAAS